MDNLRTRLQNLANADVDVLCVKDAEYGSSWKKRGGVGAFMMLARKFDRLENAVQREHYDIFSAISEDERPEGILDDIRDLRRYLLLVEDETTRTLGSKRQEPAFEYNNPYAAAGVMKARLDGQEHPFGYEPE